MLKLGRCVDSPGEPGHGVKPERKQIAKGRCESDKERSAYGERCLGRKWMTKDLKAYSGESVLFQYSKDWKALPPDNQKDLLTMMKEGKW